MTEKERIDYFLEALFRRFALLIHMRNEAPKPSHKRDLLRAQVSIVHSVLLGAERILKRPEPARYPIQIYANEDYRLHETIESVKKKLSELGDDKPITKTIPVSDLGDSLRYVQENNLEVVEIRLRPKTKASLPPRVEATELIERKQ